jgi:hypothetical protein
LRARGRARIGNAGFNAKLRLKNRQNGAMAAKRAKSRDKLLRGFIALLTTSVI